MAPLEMILNSRANLNHTKALQVQKVQTMQKIYLDDRLIKWNP